MSTEPLQDEKQAELLRHIDRLEIIGQKWLGSFNKTQSSNSTVNISAGSWVGVVLMISAAFVLGYSMATSTNLSREISTIESKQVDQGDKLDAIYMMAPQLNKPKEKTDEHAKQ